MLRLPLCSVIRLATDDQLVVSTSGDDDALDIFGQYEPLGHKQFSRGLELGHVIIAVAVALLNGASSVS